MLRVAIVLFCVSCLTACAADRQGDQVHRGAAAQGLAPGAVIQYVRLRSGLPDDQAMAVLHSRVERFREVPGLLQKIYGRDAQTGEICGIYIFESQAALDAFRQGELSRTIPTAYQVESARVERYEVLMTLYPGVRAE